MSDLITVSISDSTTSLPDSDAYSTLEASQHAQLLSSGMSPSDLLAYITKKKTLETYRLNLQLYKTSGWTIDSTITRNSVILNAAAALETLNRRIEAIYLLENNIFLGEDVDSDLEDEPMHPSFMLALSKLYFKDDLGLDALKLVDKLITLFSSTQNPTQIQHQRIADAYYLAGWICIHMDDHSKAYEYWIKGSLDVPGDENLSRQKGKRDLWDGSVGGEERRGCEELDVFGSCFFEGFLRERDFSAFKVSPELKTSTPALSLFEPSTQKDELVFLSKKPILTATECSNVVEIVNTFIDNNLSGEWSTVRSSTVKTTDVAVEDIPQLRGWLKVVMEDRLWPMLECLYPRLSDGTSLIDSDGKSRMRLHDAFIVRYDMDDESISLPEHSDTSSMSFTLSLNERGKDFEGGGTWFEAINKEGGKVVDGDLGRVTAFAGPLRHAGYPIIRGTRVILVLFCYVEGFGYGKYIKEYQEKYRLCEEEESKEEVVNEDGIKASGDKPGGYVVYRQTVELANMLSKENF